MGIFSAYSLFRLGKTVPTLFGVFTITLHAYGGLPRLLEAENWRVFVLAEGALFLLLCAGFLMNDLVDVAYDRINRPATVYIGSRLSARAAAALTALLFAGALALALLAGRQVPLVMALQALVLAAYNLTSKKLSYAKPFVISLLFVSIYPLSIAIADGGVPGPRRDSLLIFPVWLWLTALSYEFTTDARDWAGDSTSGAGGFTARFGPARMMTVAKIVAAAALPIAFVPSIAGMCGLPYLAGALFAAAALYGSLIFFPKLDFITVLHLDVVPIVVSSIVDILAAP